MSLTPISRVPGCWGKWIYPSRRRARHAARSQRDKNGDIVVPYACRHCGRIHLGGTNKMRKTPYRRRGRRQEMTHDETVRGSRL